MMKPRAALRGVARAATTSHGAAERRRDDDPRAARLARLRRGLLPRAASASGHVRSSSPDRVAGASSLRASEYWELRAWEGGER
ncbi:hypothetical protein Dimus_037060, partial [Dionaea muscipula]